MKWYERFTIIIYILAITTVAWAANQAIKDRTELAEAPNAADEIPIYDTSATAGKRLGVDNLFLYLGAAYDTEAELDALFAAKEDQLTNEAGLYSVLSDVTQFYEAGDEDSIAAAIAEGELADSIVVSADIKDGEIVNADIAAGAAIVGSKLDLSAPGAIGGTTPAAVTATTLTAGGGTVVDADKDLFGKSLTLDASTSPGWVFQDSDDAAGTAGVFGNSSGGDNDVIMSLGVEIAGSESTVFVELDGVSETVDVLKPLTVSGAITGLMKVGADITGAVSHDTTDLHGVMYKFTAAATVTLDAAADTGYGACALYRIRDAAEAAVIDVQVGEKINFEGTALAAGTAITATGAGEFVSLCSTTDTDGSGTDGYDVYGHSSGWASE